MEPVSVGGRGIRFVVFGGCAVTFMRKPESPGLRLLNIS